MANASAQWQSNYASKSRPGIECLVGEWRLPHNDLQNQRVGGGHAAIHDDATAAKIGFGAAPIHGTVHWSQFTPLFLQAFGPAWFETGSISVHFVTPVNHLNPVRAFIQKPDPTKTAQQLEIWMEHLDGRLVLQGTASVGLKPGQMKTMAQTKIDGIKPVKGKLLFQRIPAGTKVPNPDRARIDFENEVGPMFPFTLKEKLQIITEYHPWFGKETGTSSPWGRPILPPEALNQIMLGYCGYNDNIDFPHPKEEQWFMDVFAGGKTPVGLFGGCEVIMHEGPVFPEEEYLISRELIATGETPRAEFRWTKATLKSVKTGNVVAEMTLQEMSLKGSFDGYEALRAKSDAQAPTAKL